jgi:hypothetical protein
VPVAAGSAEDLPMPPALTWAACDFALAPHRCSPNRQQPTWCSRSIAQLCSRSMKHGPYVPHEFGADAEAHYATGRGWLTAACFSSIPWPEEDVRVTYDGDDYFLRGAR